MSGINQQDTDMKWFTAAIMASALFHLIFLYDQKTKSSYKNEKEKKTELEPPALQGFESLWHASWL